MNIESYDLLEMKKMQYRFSEKKILLLSTLSTETNSADGSFTRNH